MSDREERNSEIKTLTTELKIAFQQNFDPIKIERLIRELKIALQRIEVSKLKLDIVNRVQKELFGNGRTDDDYFSSFEDDDVIEDEISNCGGIPSNFNRTKFSFRDIEESLEKFSGDENKNVNEWLAEFENQAKIFHWNRIEMMIFCRRLLKGSARMFVNSELKPKSWIQLKSGLRKEFLIEVNGALIHKKLVQKRKRPDQSYAEYCYEMIDIAAPAKIDTRALVTYIVDGIDDCAENKLFLYSSKNVKELKEKIRV